MKMKKKSLLMAGACLPLLMTGQNSSAVDNRLQYSASDANALATDDNANTVSFTFSHGGRKGSTLTASDAYSAGERHSSGDNGSSAGGSGGNSLVDERGFDENGIHQVTGTQYDEDGYDVDGYNERGFNSEGVNQTTGQFFDSEGYKADGSNVCTTGDFEWNGGESYTCCYPTGTPITLANGSTKPVEEITYDDELLVWNFDEGKFDHAKPLWIKIPETAQEYNYLRFSDGSILKTINKHRIFNQEAGKFTYPLTDETPLGTHTLSPNGKMVTLVEQRVVKEEVIYYNIITAQHINCFAGGVCTSCRLNNMYPIKDLKFVKDNRKLVPYEEYAELDRKWYDGLRLGEQPREIQHKGDVDFGDKSLVDYVKRIIKIMAENESIFAKAC